METDTVSEEERRHFVRCSVTLDGRPAIISGVQNPVALVRILPDGRCEQYSWQACRRVIAAGGAFRS